ncbi:hypothetical protein [Paenibacillus sp. FSL H7-0331]|uniref:hypothetical protein n=1 Tax=Paenibacillus sp. FSL H7-0331 TaxID=1920421 RepID=UPI00096D5209|nr:hypothetical protein [Paenibacillus sp. FSL H7-0331]OME97318.1 hypothetical protein BK127_40880 [Paenibacillus sp. FSL H7-0331]
MGWPKIKVSVENVIQAAIETGEDLLDRANIKRNTENTKDWADVAVSSAKEVDWTEVSNSAEFLRQAADDLQKAAQEGTQEQIQRKWLDVLEAYEQLKHDTLESMNNVLQQSYDIFIEEVWSELNEVQQEYAEAISEVLEKIKELRDLFDIKKVIDELLNEAESMLEEYLINKLLFLETIDVKGLPEVNIDLDRTTIKFDLYIYILLIDYEGTTPNQDCFAEISIRLEQDLTDIRIPKPKVDPKFYLDRVEEDIRERVKERLEEEKDALVEGLLEMFFSEYVEVFNQFKKYLDML